MKNFVPISILVFIILVAAVKSFGQVTLITDPANGHYCAGTVPLGVKIKIENSVNGTLYFLKKQGQPGNQAQVTGNGGTVAFPGNFQIGTYFTVPPTNNVTVVMDPQPVQHTVIVTDNGEFCNYPGATGVQIGLQTSTIGVKYTLYKGAATIDQWTSDWPLLHYFAPFITTPGTYHVVAEIIATGCTRNLGSVTVISHQPPTADFSAAPQMQCSSTPVQFTDLSTEGSGAIVEWFWNFDDPNSGSKNTDTLQNPLHTFESWGNGTGTFDVFLKATDDNGCEHTISKPVIVKQKPDATLSASGAGISTKVVNDTTTFAYCGENATALFTFANFSTTQATNTWYTIHWGDGSPDYSSATFDNPIDHTYNGLGYKTLIYTVNGANGCNHVKKYYVFIGSTPSGGIVNPGGMWGTVPFVAQIPVSDEAYENTPGTVYEINFGDGTPLLLLEQSQLPLDKIISHTYEVCSNFLNYCLDPNDLRYTFKTTCTAKNPCDNAYSLVCPIYVSCPVVPGFGGGGGSVGGGGYWGAGPGEIIACNPVTFSDSTQPGFYITENGISFTQDTYYSWDFGDPLSGANNTSDLSNPTHNFTNSCQEYTVTLTAFTGENGGNNSGIITITQQVFIQDNPSADFVMEDFGNDCVPKEVQIANTSDIGCFGVPLYKWSVLPAVGWEITTPGFENDPTYPDPLFQFNTSGTFEITLVIENSCGTDTITKSVLACELPKVEFDDDEYYYCGPGERDFATVNVPVYELNCDPPITYFWEVTGPAPVTFVAPTTSASDFPIIDFPVAGDYLVSVTIENDCGTDVTTQGVHVTNSLMENVIYEDMGVCNNMAPIILTGELPTGGTGAITFKWEKYSLAVPVWTFIPGGIAQNYTIANPLSETTWYRRWAYDDGDCSDLSNEIEVTVFPAIQENNIVQDQIICQGSAPQLLTGSEAFGGNDPMTYQWYYSIDGINWILIPGADQLDFQPANLFVTTYFHREAISGPCNPLVSAPVTITVCEPIEINFISDDQVICQGTPPDELSGTDPGGACGNIGFQWQYKTDAMPNFINIPTGTQQNYQPLAINVKTYFQRIVTSDICPDNISNIVTIDILPKPNANAGVDQPIVNGATASLVGTVNGGTLPYQSYKWSPAVSIQGNPNQQNVTTIPLNATTTFTFCVTDANGCEGCDNMTVTVQGDPLTVSINPESDEICPGETAQLCANALGGTGNYIYSWASNPPGFISSDGCVSVTPGITTTYTVTVFDGWSTVTDFALVTVLPVPVITSILDITICSGEQLDYSPTSTIPGTTYTWITIPGGGCSGNSSGSGTIIENIIHNAGSDECIVTYDITPVGPGPSLCNGNQVTLTVHVMPIAQITNAISQQTVVSGQLSLPVTFESDVAGVSFHWEYSSDNCPGFIGFTLNSGNTETIPAQIISILPGGPPTCILKYEITAFIELPGGKECWGTPYFYNYIINLEPTEFDLICPAPVCSGGSATISLNGSETGVDYLLLRDGVIPILPVQPGTGFQLDWTNIIESGIYTVRATNQTNAQIALMNGLCNFIVNPLPSLFVLTAENNDHCTPVILKLSGSELNVEYTLLLDNFVLQVKPGTGLPDFLVFDPVNLPGDYIVHARYPLTGCERDMLGTIHVDPTPEEFPIFPEGIICEGETICIDGWENGVEYQLWKNDIAFSGFVTGVQGEPFICFNPPTDGPGVYKVYAQYPITGCAGFFSQEIVVNENPFIYNMSPEAGCPGTEIILEGCQDGITYELWFNHQPSKNKNPKIDEPLLTINCDPSMPTLSFGQWFDEGTYTVKAVNSATNCVSWMADSTIIKAAPDFFNLTPNGTGCGSQEIILDGSEIDVEYFLYINFQAEPSVIGTGFPLSFGERDVTGVYTVKARFNHPDAECWSQMTGSYEITSFPTAFIVDPLPGTYCPCVNPTLSSSQLNINYYIQNTTLGTESAAYPGTGNPLIFNPVCDPGSYIIYARHPNFPSCEKQMTGGFAIGLPPEKYNLSGPLPSAFCEGENGVTLTLDNSQDDVKYQLYKLPDIAEGIPKDGITGSSLTWENITAGEYFVEAVFANDPNCPTIMDNTVAVEEISLPTVYAGDDGTICLSETYLVPNVVMTNQSSFSWTVETGNGSLSNSTTPNPTYLPDQADAGTIIILKLEVDGISVCAGSSASDFISILIEPLPEIVSAGDDGLICFDQSYTVPNVTMNHVSDWFWIVSSGNGVLDDPELLNPTYTPGAGDAGTTIILTLETYGTLSCSNEIATGDVFIQIIAVPVVTSVTAQTICSGEAVNYVPLSDVPGTTFNWISTNTTAGCVTGNSPVGSDIISNILINNCNTVQTIKYTITPFGPPATNCEGAPVDLTVTINPVANITNNVSEQSINSGETSLEVVFQTDVMGTLVNYTWSGVASNPELQGWISDGTGDLPQMAIMIDETSPNPPDEAFVTYTVIPEVAGCAGNPFDYTIQVYLLPTIFNVTVEGGGEYCNDGQSCIDITLSNSQPGKIYKLFQNDVYQNGIDKTGNGTPIQWCVAQAGIYTVKAQNPITGVEILMNGSAEVFARPIPNKFTLSIQQPGDFCVPITPRLNSSQVGAFYDLYRDGEVDPVQNNVEGTGNALLFESQEISGTYSVKARIPYIAIVCERQMDGLIFAEPLPVEYEVTPSDPFCEGENQICLESSEIDVMYQLRKDGNPFGDVIPGTGLEICFPTITQNGNFKVFAKRTTGSLCEVLFDQQTIVRPLPSKFTLSPANSCPGAEIILNGCQPDVDYYLFLESAKDGNREWGQIAGPLTCTLGEVNFGACYIPGIYHVKAVDQLTNCFSWMQNSLTIFSEPTPYPVQPQGTAGCDSIEIYLNSFETDVTYYLWREFLGTTYPAGIDDGSDGEVNFGLKSDPGTYTIEAVIEHVSGITCGNWMEGSVSIANPPALFTLKYEESLCLPVKFYLDGSESGVTYTLKKTASTFSESIIGDGAPVYFSEVSLSGNYYVMADNGCVEEMINNWTVLDAPLPFLLSPEGGGALCADDNIQIGMNNSEANVDYYLYKIGNPQYLAMESRLMSGPFVFTIANPFEPGTYRVQAINANGCKSWMADEKIIHSAPDKYNVTATKNGVLYLSGEYCPPVDIGLDYSETGITYTLITPDNNDVILEGTGSSFSFGTFSSPGEYAVIAKNLATSCDSEMNGNVIISDGPTGFDLVCDEPKYCIGDTQAVTIILEDSQNGVEYQLYKGNLSNPVFPPQQGKGSNLTWTDVSQFGPGSYLIRGKFTSDPLCEALMNNEIMVQELSLPTATIGGNSTICEQSELHIPITPTGDQSWVVEYSCNNGIPESVTFDAETGAPYFITVFPVESPSVYKLESIKYAESPYCGGSVNEANFTVSLDTLPFAFAGNLGTTCENLPYLLFEADTAFSSAVSWQQISGPAGVFENSSELNTSFICTENIQDISLVELLLVAQGRGQCSLQTDSSFITIEIVPLPEPDAGDDATICASQSYLLAGTTNNGFSTSAFWEDLSGLGQFSDPNILNPTYTLISPESISAPVDVTLKLTEMGFGPCILEPVSSSVIIRYLEPLPVCNAGPDTMMCANDNFQLMSQSLFFTTPQWVDLSGLGEFNDPNIPDPVYSLFDPGLITEPVSVALLLTVHGIGLCADETNIDTIFIQIDPLPQVYAGADHTICVSDTIWITDYTMAFSSDTTWQIQQGFGQLLPPDQINQYPGYVPSIDDIGLVTGVILELQGSGIGKCTNEPVSDELIIFVNPMPFADAGSDGITCETEDYQLIEATILNATEDVFWEVVEGNGIIGEPSVLNTYYHPVTEDAGTTVKLRLTAFGVDACTSKQISDEMLIQIAPLPVLFAGSDATICMTGSLQITDATALHYSTLLWSTSDGLGDFNPPDQLITTFTPDPLQGGSTIEIILSAFGTGNCLSEEVMSVPALIVVDSVPTIYPGADITTCLSAGPVEIIGASLNNYTSFWWMINDGQGFGQLTNENSLSPIYNPDPRDTELIDGVKLRLSATGAGQCIAEVFDSIMTIYIDSLPAVFAGADASICMNNLSYKILDAQPKYAINPQWTTTNGSGTFNPPDAFVTTYTIGETDAGKIIELNLTVSGTGSCVDNFAFDALLLQVDSLPMAFAGINDTTCINSPYFLGNARSTHSSSVKWDVISGNGSFDNDLLINPSYIPGPGDESTTAVLQLTAFGMGMCNTEIYQSSVTIYVVPLPEVNAGPDDAICETETEYEILGALVDNSGSFFWTRSGGNGIFLNPDILTPSYEPALNDVGQTITFNLNAVGLGKCNDTTIIDSRTLKIGKKPEVRFFIIEDSTSCAFSPTWFTDFSYTYFNEEIISRTWDFGDGDPITVSPETVVVSHKYETAGNKTVTLTINIAIDGIPLPACENSITKIIEVSPLPVVKFNYTQSNYCNGEVYFEDKSESSIEIVHWDFGDNQHAHENPIIHTYETPGDKIVMLAVQDQNGCQDTLTETISVQEFFDFNILFEYAGICNEYKFWADNILPAGNSIQDYFWTFGDGSDAVNQDTAVHEFISSGQYNLILKAIDSSGCLRIKDYIIDIPECPDNIAGQLFIPNAFAPDEVTPSNPVSPDSEFKVFLPKGQNITEYQIEIYDMWGNLLWQSTTIQDGRPVEFWDGKYKNELVPAGQYLWKAYAKFGNEFWSGQSVNYDPNGKKFTTGTVTVIR